MSYPKIKEVQVFKKNLDGTGSCLVNIEYSKGHTQAETVKLFFIHSILMAEIKNANRFSKKFLAQIKQQVISELKEINSADLVKKIHWCSACETYHWRTDKHNWPEKNFILHS